MKNIKNQLFIIALFGIFTSCELGDDSLEVKIKNESSQIVNSYTISSGYINMSESANYEYFESKNQKIAPGEQFSVMINVSENGSGDFEAVKVTVGVNGQSYSGEDSYLYYHDEGTNSSIWAFIRDKTDSTVYVSIDIWE